MPISPTDERLADLTYAQMKLEHANDFVKFLACAQDRGPGNAAHHFLERFKGTFSDHLVRKALDLNTKAAVAPGTTTTTSWAGALVPQLATAFVALARSDSLLGRIPGLRLVPFNTRVPLETQAASYAWIPENGLVPVSKPGFTNGVTLGPTKCMGVVIVTKELALLSTPGSEAALRDTLIAGLNAFTDKNFLDPTVAAVAGKNPASITNGTTPVAGTANLQTDVKTLIAAFFAGRPGARDPVIIANGGNAAAIRGFNPGFGFPVITSEHALTNVIMADPKGILVADNGAAIDVSDQAAMESDDAPVGTAAAVVISLWQQNLRGFRIERFVNWQALTGAVKYLTTP